MVLWRPPRPGRTNTKRCPFHHRGQECKSRKSGVTGKFDLGAKNEAEQRLTEFCQENAWVIANTLFQQHKRQLYTWTSSDGQYQNQIDYILCSQRWRSSIQSAKTRQGADCGSDRELLIAKFRLKLKKVGKTTRPFRYDLNQSLTVEIQIERIRSDRQSAWRTMDEGSCHCSGGSGQDHPKKKKCKRQNGCLRRPYK